MRKTIVKGTLVLSVLSLVAKILSIIYKIPYQNLTGDVGFYIYQQVYPLFALLFIFSSYVIPLVVSEERLRGANLKVVMSKIFGWFWGIAIVIFLGNFIFIWLFNDANLKGHFLVLALTMVFVPLPGILRGIVQAEDHLIHHVGISLVLEQLLRVGMIIFVLLLYVNQKVQDLYLVAQLSFLGYTIGMLASSVYLVFISKSLKHKQEQNVLQTQKVGLRILSLVLSASILIGMQLIDSITITHLLDLPFSKAIEIKGIYDRSYPLVQVAVFFVSPILSVFVPRLKNVEEESRLFALIFTFALPATIGLMLVLGPVNEFLFKSNALNLELTVNMIAILLYSLIVTATALPQVKQKHMNYMICFGLLSKILLNWLLIPRVGILGAALATIMGLLLILMFILIRYPVIIKVEYMNLCKNILATGVMGLIIGFGPKLPLFMTILLGSLIYFIALYFLNAFNLKSWLKKFINNKKDA